MTRQIAVYDDVLARPDRYRQWALQQPFGSHQLGPDLWRGIAPVSDPTLAIHLARRMARARVDLTFLRKSPEGQPEPNFIHSDAGMGEWTAILYLNPHPPAEDGTTFWREKASGDTFGEAEGRDLSPELWEPWHHVEGRFNRLLVFKSLLFHSRALLANFGAGDEARLIQVAFGGWAA